MPTRKLANSLYMLASRRSGKQSSQPVLTLLASPLHIMKPSATALGRLHRSFPIEKGRVARSLCNRRVAKKSGKRAKSILTVFALKKSSLIDRFFESTRVLCGRTKE